MPKPRADIQYRSNAGQQFQHDEALSPPADSQRFDQPRHRISTKAQQPILRFVKFVVRPETHPEHERVRVQSYAKTFQRPHTALGNHHPSGSDRSRCQRRRSGSRLIMLLMLQACVCFGRRSESCRIMVDCSSHSTKYW